VLLAVDGNDALDQFTHHKEIELVITDLDMPTLPGSALARKIWQLKPTMKILAMSGLEAASADPLRPKHFEEAFLLKPFAAQELLVFTHHLLHPDPVEFSA
jgi:CheY-like chemotaxis protein